MNKPQQVLILEPNNELTFKGPFTEYVNANLTLSNPSPRDVYFKVKTTAPKFYCVRPNSGIIKANDKTQINVMLQSVESPDALENERNRHKFMIQTAFAPDEGQPPVDQFWKGVDSSLIMDSKLRVMFQRPFGFGDDSSAKDDYEATSTFLPSKNYIKPSSEQKYEMTKDMNDPHVALQKEIELRKMYQDEKSNLERENYALLEKLEKLTQNAAGAGGMLQQDNVQMLHAVLFAILALLLGLIVGKLL